MKPVVEKEGTMDTCVYCGKHFTPDQNHPEHLCWDNLASARQAAATWKMECEKLRRHLDHDQLRAALLPFAAAAGRPGRLLDGNGNPLSDEAVLGLGVKVSAWKRANELTGA